MSDPDLMKSMSLLEEISESDEEDLEDTAEIINLSDFSFDLEAKVKKVDSYQIPPSIKAAEKHYLYKSIGFTPKKPEDYCPCCLEPKKQPFGLFTRSEQTMEYGSTIALYFQFVQFILGFCLIMTFTSAWPAFNKAKLFYEWELEREGEVKWGNRLFYDYPPEFLSENASELEEIRVHTLWTDLLANVLVLIFTFWFQYRQRRLIKHLDKNRKVDSSDFAVMIGNVNKNDSNFKITQYVHKLAQRAGLPKPRVVKINRASFGGNFTLFVDKIRSKEKEIKITRRKFNQVQKYLSDEQKNEGKLYLINLESELLAIKSKKLEFERLQVGHRQEFDKNSIAFVTLATVNEKDSVLYASHGFYCWLVRCCKKKQGLKVMPAPHPKDIHWQNIGYSTKTRKIKLIFGMISVYLTFPVFTLGFIAIGLARKYMTLYWSNYQIVRILNTFLMPIIVISYNIVTYDYLKKLVKTKKFLTENHTLIDKCFKKIFLSFFSYAVSLLLTMFSA
jgi:hypothetical protein